MSRAIAEVDHLFGMSQRVAGIALMAGVGGARGVTVAQRGHQNALDDGSSQADAPHAAELAVPTGGRHPHFDPDIRIAGGLYPSRDAAERRKRFRRAYLFALA